MSDTIDTLNDDEFVIQCICNNSTVRSYLTKMIKLFNVNVKQKRIKVLQRMFYRKNIVEKETVRKLSVISLKQIDYIVYKTKEYDEKIKSLDGRNRTVQQYCYSSALSQLADRARYIIKHNLRRDIPLFIDKENLK